MGQSDAYDKYAKATGATFDDTVGMLALPAEDYDNLESLFFNINGVSCTFSYPAMPSRPAIGVIRVHEECPDLAPLGTHISYQHRRDCADLHPL